MKVLRALTLASVATCAASTATLASADREFKPPTPQAGKKPIKAAAKFGNSGAKMDFCPAGDCTNGQLVRLMMSRLEEYGPDGKRVAKADNFNKLNATWTTMEEMVVDGVTIATTSYVAEVPVEKLGNAHFNLTTSIYLGNGTTMNGNQTLSVPAGALKFAVTIEHWPFASPSNHLRFGVTLKARGKDGKDRPKPEKKKANVTDVDRVDMGEGMFMDAPALAVLDGVTAAINSSVDASNAEIEYVWEYPYFNKTMFYDPVVGSEDPSATGAGDGDGDGDGEAGSGTPTTTPSPTTSPTPTPSPTSGSSALLLSACTAAVTALVGSLLLA